MKTLQMNNSATFVNFKNHTNSSASQGATYTSAKSDAEASITRNQIILSPQQPSSIAASLDIQEIRD